MEKLNVVTPHPAFLIDLVHGQGDGVQGRLPVSGQFAGFRPHNSESPLPHGLLKNFLFRLFLLVLGRCGLAVLAGKIHDGMFLLMKHVLKRGFPLTPLIGLLSGLLSSAAAGTGKEG